MICSHRTFKHDFAAHDQREKNSLDVRFLAANTCSWTRGTRRPRICSDLFAELLCERYLWRFVQFCFRFLERTYRLSIQRSALAGPSRAHTKSSPLLLPRREALADRYLTQRLVEQGRPHTLNDDLFIDAFRNALLIYALRHLRNTVLHHRHNELTRQSVFTWETGVCWWRKETRCLWVSFASQSTGAWCYADPEVPQHHAVLLSSVGFVSTLRIRPARQERMN